MFTTFVEVVEAAKVRRVEIAKDLERLKVEHDAASEVREKLEEMDRQLTAEEFKQLDDAEDRYWQTDNKIEQLGDEDYELMIIIDRFERALPKVKSLAGFVNMIHDLN